VRGADVNATDQDGNRPLHSACFLGHADIAQLLLSNGADPMGRHANGNTALDTTAVDEGRTRVITDLIGIACDWDAIQKGRAKCVKLLKKAGSGR